MAGLEVIEAIGLTDELAIQIGQKIRKKEDSVFVELCQILFGYLNIQIAVIEHPSITSCTNHRPTDFPYALAAMALSRLHGPDTKYPRSG